MTDLAALHDRSAARRTHTAAAASKGIPIRSISCRKIPIACRPDTRRFVSLALRIPEAASRDRPSKTFAAIVQ